MNDCTAREDEKNAQNSTQTRERGDQGHQQTQAGTGDSNTPRRNPPPPLPPRTAITWGKPVVEEIYEDETTSKNKNEGNVDIDVSEVTEDTGVGGEGIEEKATKSKASDKDGDAESNADDEKVTESVDEDIYE